VAMERLRWLEREPPATRVDVNTAAAYLDYWRDGAPVGRRNVVVGQPGWETPQLGAPIFQLVANPSWNVPKSIEEKELSKKGAGYLASQNIVRKDGRLVQLPGPKNALGQVKFDMKDDEAIYLHDTPAKALFGEPERHESHGCVRVQNALDFARTLAQADGVLDKFEVALAGGDETFVKLKTSIPVRLMYHTAFLGTDGRVHFAPDVYGWDNDVATALGYPSKGPSQFKARGTDVGP
jgi:L,D-transpeptidase YcbB